MSTGKQLKFDISSKMDRQSKVDKQLDMDKQLEVDKQSELVWPETESESGVDWPSMPGS